MKEAQPAATSTKIRKPRYKTAFSEQAYKLCLLGATDKELETFFGATPKTLTRWKNTHEEFARQITKGKKAADMEVALSLYNASIDRVITIKQPLKCKEVYYDDNGKRVEKERIEVVEIEKHIPADFRSQQFWLKNRNPQQWSDKHDEANEPQPEVLLNLGSGVNPHPDETLG